MPRFNGTTDRQSNFLRACAKDPTGLTPKDWPSATVFRKWMRRQGFRLAIRGIRDSLRYQADLHIASASAAAAKLLSAAVNDGTVISDEQVQRLRGAREQIQSLTTLLRLAHLRHRFSADPAEHAQLRLPPEVRRAVDEMTMIVASRAHPDLTIGQAKELLEELCHTRGELTPWEIEEGKDPKQVLQGSTHK
jgi:hypothetical protein